jgi:2-oxoisovalerate dehydrogenase E2 component (dihydrolipoyl transacylase)
MSQFTFKMPDLGEGTVDAEIVAWHTKPGDTVSEDQLIVEVMTDKAAVEVPAPVSGRVISVTGAPGDKVAVGSPLIVFEVTDAAKASTVAAAAPAPTPTPAPAPSPAPAASTPVQAAKAAPASASAPVQSAPAARQGRVMTSPANRRRASEAGIDLATVTGSGPGGRILTADLQTAAPGSAAGAGGGAGRAAADAADTSEIKVIGLRRLIAERMSEAKRTIPHFAYVEEVDVTELESLREHLNHTRAKDAGSLSYLPLVAMALIRVLESFPQCNVLYDAARGVLVRHRAVHLGIATQTPDGLKVPVVHNAQRLGLWDIAAEIRRLAERARSNKATRDELTGSTITITSLGKLGGIASTPIINSPEVAIIGLNKAVERPMVYQGAIAVRRIMNLSSSFDHRFVDGYDAAAMIQALKERLEHPATIFIPTVKS